MVFCFCKCMCVFVICSFRLRFCGCFVYASVCLWVAMTFHWLSDDCYRFFPLFSFILLNVSYIVQQRSKNLDSKSWMSVRVKLFVFYWTADVVLDLGNFLKTLGATSPPGSLHIWLWYLLGPPLEPYEFNFLLGIII